MSRESSFLRRYKIYNICNCVRDWTRRRNTRQFCGNWTISTIDIKDHKSFDCQFQFQIQGDFLVLVIRRRNFIVSSSGLFAVLFDFNSFVHYGTLAYRNTCFYGKFLLFKNLGPYPRKGLFSHPGNIWPEKGRMRNSFVTVHMFFCSLFDLQGTSLHSRVWLCFRTCFIQWILNVEAPVKAMECCHDDSMPHESWTCCFCDKWGKEWKTLNLHSTEIFL